MLYCSACGARLAAAPPIVCDACGAAHWRNAKPCAGALVTRADGRLLLVRRAIDPWRGRWDIPGGFCEVDEHPEVTAVREVREETGFDVVVTGLVGMWIDAYPPAEVTLNIYFHAAVSGGDAKPDSAEVAELAWFEPLALPAAEEMAFPEHAGLVLAAWSEARDARETR
ncbi:MAG TPA: NUDIX domain-containing protein [Acidimicrobiia bacterium]|nr:NUDIX domain-containing protein [Acidimicrobiia bacterium]